MLMSKLTLAKPNGQRQNLRKRRKEPADQAENAIRSAVGDLLAAFQVAFRRADRLRPAMRALVDAGAHDDYAVHIAFDQLHLANRIDATATLVAASFGFDPLQILPSPNDQICLLGICDWLSQAASGLKDAKGDWEFARRRDACGTVIRQLVSDVEDMISAS
jgi:hypothetical protein